MVAMLDAISDSIGLEVGLKHNVVDTKLTL